MLLAVGAVGRGHCSGQPGEQGKAGKAAGKARLVVDLHAVDFIDSSGLGALIGGLKPARQQGGDLRIAAAGDQVRAVLKLTNLDRILSPYATVEEALHGW